MSEPTVNIEEKQEIISDIGQTIPIKGDTGADGKSTYQIWLDEGNTGTEAEFLASLKGEKGDAGDGTTSWEQVLNKPDLYTQAQVDEKLSAKADSATTYNKTEVDNKISAIPTPDVSAQITAHNTSETAHSDIRTLIDTKISAIPTPDVSGQITAHNSSETAHADIRTTLSNKVDKSGTKQLSDENYTTDEKTKLLNIEAGAQVNPDLTSYAKTADVNSSLILKANQADLTAEIARAQAAEALKVDKIDGKGLSTNDFTNADLVLLNNQSGTNTGDETQSSIINKIGYTPLATNGDGSLLTALKQSQITFDNILVKLGGTSSSMAAGVTTKLNNLTAIIDNIESWDYGNQKLNITRNCTLIVMTTMTTGTSSTGNYFRIYKNGSQLSEMFFVSYSGFGFALAGTFAPDDYVEFYAKVTSTTSAYCGISLWRVS